ncbi:MAG: ornithine cyclodeaminase family protein [Planctomycetota bacterium]
MLVLSAEDVRQALPMAMAIEAMKRAFAALSDGRAVVPPRAHVPVEAHDGVSLVMPALVADADGEALAVKVVSLFDGNPERGLARIQVAVLAFDPETGRPLALLEGATLTALRTGAASGAATDLLARPDSRAVGVLGAGAQARTQLEAVCTVRHIETVRVYDPRPGAAEAFRAEMAGHGPVPADVRAAPSPREAVAEADILCAATTAREPAFDDADLPPGTHINAIGSYQPDVQELPAATVARALVIVDSREAALEETGDLIQPIRQGLFGPDHIHAELGELVLGRASGRTSPEQLTVFKSVGVAVQDAAAARAALSEARRLGLGQTVRW